MHGYRPLTFEVSKSYNVVVVVPEVLPVLVLVKQMLFTKKIF